MDYIKKNKLTIIVIVLFLILVFAAVQFTNIFFASSDAVYGNRLEGIENVKISKNTIDQVKSSFQEDGVSKTTVRISGRTVEIILTVNSDVSLDTAKSYANKSLEPFSEEQKGYYDFQIFVKKENESENFPIIGYKQKAKESITWSKDR